MSKLPDLEGAQVIHLGKVSRKQINKYKKGYGKMFTEVQQVVAKAKREQLGSTVVPSVVVHRRKGKKLQCRRYAFL